MQRVVAAYVEAGQAKRPHRIPSRILLVVNTFVLVRARKGGGGPCVLFASTLSLCGCAMGGCWVLQVAALFLLVLVVLAIVNGYITTTAMPAFAGAL